MNINDVNRILNDTAYTRYGGSDGEKRCALYIKGECQKLGLSAAIESFEIKRSPKDASDTSLSHNVILDIKGESEETVIASAHYDSVATSHGAYDNMSGAIILLYLAEKFKKAKLKRSLRLLWCGSEERGLIGSRKYCETHEKELRSAILNINLDMLGSAYGKFVFFSCTDEASKKYFEEYFKETRTPCKVKYDIRSSDSNSFIFYDVPAVSFARYARDLSFVHTENDTRDKVSPARLIGDARIIGSFTEFILNRDTLPSFGISEEIAMKVDEKFLRYKS